MDWRIVASVSYFAVIGCGTKGTEAPSPDAIGGNGDSASPPGDDSTSTPAGKDASIASGGDDQGTSPGGEDGEAESIPDAASEHADASGDARDSGVSPEAAPGGGGCSRLSSDPLVGWASVDGLGVKTTTGGAGGSTVKVSTLSDLNTNAGGTTARIIEISGTISGNVTVGSNKTLVGACGAEIHGHIQMSGSVNVIVRNLTVVGYNCTDNPSDCSGGADAISVERQAHHLWFDHNDISDGSDGNLDITHACDFITVSWTKFHYSGRRTDPAGAAGGHQFSNLIGHSDSNASEDTGHLTVTFHHDWWADNVVERMPRVRFGQVHLFDNLYTAAGNDYCIGVGVSANIRDENNVFIGVKNPIDSTDYSNSTSIIHSTGNLLQMTTGTSQDIGGTAFTPPYAYTLDPASGVEATVKNGAGP